MASHLTDFERQVIVLLKSENPSWGYTKCAGILPNFFASISVQQFDRVVRRLKNDGIDDARKRKRGSGTSTVVTEEMRQSVLQLAVTPENSPSKGHLSQRRISQELHISKGTVFNVLKESSLKCYRKVQCQQLTENHCIARTVNTVKLNL